MGAYSFELGVLAIIMVWMLIIVELDINGKKGKK
jgi:hypothetical protein